MKGRQASGTPFKSGWPRSCMVMPDPMVMSFTVLETRTSPGLPEY